MITSELGLLDANILVYAVNENSRFHPAARSLRAKALTGEIPVCITPQVLAEFYAISTDSRRVEKPLTVDEAVVEVHNYIQADHIRKVFFTEESSSSMIALLKAYEVTRQAVFDLQLVAVMLSNGVRRIYTYNAADFSQFREIEVLSPETVLK